MPRLYGKKVGIGVIDRRVRKRVEERDAIVWTVDSANKVVNVKIQGSDTLLKARYHQVLTSTPAYLKPGAAVTLRHRRGNKGYVEVVGTGRAIPTPVGAGSSLPTVDLTDIILSGMEVLATDPTTMTVRVNPGTYRYNNGLYVWSETNNFFYEMNDPAELIMGTDDVNMGGQYYVVTIPAAPSTPKYGRYDILVVGPHDNQIDVVSGSEVNLSTTTPTMPSVPANHVLVDWVFVMYGDTVVTDDMIGKSYEEPIFSSVSISISGSWTTVDDELEWNPTPPPQPSCSIVITVYDQYGTAWNFGGARGKLTNLATFGQVYGSYTGWRSDYAESSVSTTGTFQFERDQSAAETSVPLLYEVSGYAYTIVLVLLDSGGSPI